MRILFATSEAYPLAKTGGLADVSRALPAALQRLGADIRLIMPAYPRAVGQLREPRVVAKLEPVMGVSDGIVLAGLFPDCDLPVYLVSSASLFGRAGGLYQDDNGQDWPDNAHRFAFLSQVASDIALGHCDLGWQPDVVHANDWHTGLLPLFLAHELGCRPKSVFTTHNMAFQGAFAPHEVPPLPLQSGDDLEFYGRLSYLKAGLAYGDRVTTVSPTYAQEILTPEFGCGLDGVLRARQEVFSGILNGIDEDIWNPVTDPFLAANYRASDMLGKRACKVALQHELNLDADPETPLLGFVSRLTEQKMADTLIEALPFIVGQNAQLVIVGEGDRSIEAKLKDAQTAYPAKISVTIGYDEALAHKLQAGADILLAPARFEPCGLTQLYALRYGTLPVVRRTGGLADTVVDANNQSILDRSASGFVFDDPSADSMVSALTRALALYHDPLHWRRLQLQAMTRSFGWDRSARAYMALYQELLGLPQQDDVKREHQGGRTENAARRAAG
ncbi:starch synthase [Rhizomicrobium palustre]|uniref:Glycogen synthase n=1 Tax=Rhizomicrobium palustre TaxID=189966 RepID=A0A846N1R6_9PROT|nr:glycogen synthase GlgA [Rhizomicrobium palustre]NIK89686.1 starch synthase [Rhizomicrobium palustre]